MEFVSHQKQDLSIFRCYTARLSCGTAQSHVYIWHLATPCLNSLSCITPLTTLIPHDSGGLSHIAAIALLCYGIQRALRPRSSRMFYSYCLTRISIWTISGIDGNTDPPKCSRMAMVPRNLTLHAFKFSHSLDVAGTIFIAQASQTGQASVSGWLVLP